MKNHLNLKLAHFFKDQQLQGGPYLVAVSCGVDSMVLLHELVCLQSRFSFNLAIVHVHHGWRKESDEEYKFLENYAKALSIPFYGKKLSSKKGEHDLENQARKARYAFFKEIYYELAAEGVFLGHQKQDVEETVMKRIVEGAHLSQLGGMKERSFREDMVLLRPFLSVDKRDLKQKAQDESIPYFEDSTNLDQKFLRSRLREGFFPYLEEVFNKKINDNLLHLSQQSWALCDYFEWQFQAKVKLCKLQEQEVCLFFDSTMHPFELENLMLVFFKRLKLTLSRAMLKGVVAALQGAKTVKHFETKEVKVSVSEGFCLICGPVMSQVVLEFSHENFKMPGWVYQLTY